MPLSVTQTADLGLAATAFTILPSILFMDIARLDPLTASLSWTIYAVLG
jgi:hypothetical protein